MASWAKKVSTALKGELRPGEVVESAVFVQPAGTIGQAVGTGIGGLGGRAGAPKLGDNVDAAASFDTDFGLAGMLANDPTVLALTNQRLVVMGYGTFSGKPKGVKVSMDLGDLIWVELDKQNTTYQFVAHFRDRTAKLFEAPRLNNDPEGFAAAVS